MKNIKEEIRAILMDYIPTFHLDCSNECTNKWYEEENFKDASDEILQAIEKMIEGVVGEDEDEEEYDGESRDERMITSWRIARNSFRKELREKFHKELINSEREK